MLTAHQTDRLNSRYLHATRYEVVCSHPDGRRFLVGYLLGRSGSGLFRLVRAAGPRIVNRCGLDENATFRLERGRNARAVIGEWVAEITGRTERDAILAGELDR